MTLTAALTPLTTILSSFGQHREQTVLKEREAPNDRVAVPDPDPLDWPRRLTSEMVMQGMIGSVLR